ncbi:hypothetical protein KR009_011820 [Drosophila setifemur]|nr:hypothetical protein KR009_011820 [Drosophila setifemur]
MGCSHFSETMTHCVVFAFVILVPFLSHELAISSAFEAGNITIGPACVIRATLYITSPRDRSNRDFGLPLDIDCTGNGSLEWNSFDLGAQRVAGKKHVLLDGSQTPPLGISSYGLEYLDNCVHLNSLEIQRFGGDATLKLSCGGASLLNLTTVSFEDNELGLLSEDTFEQVPHLKVLTVEKNYLKVMEPLRGCNELEELSILDETDLILKGTSLLEKLPQLRKLRLKNLKKGENKFFSQLPENLTELTVEDTPIQPGELLFEDHIFQLINVSITNCQLQSFALNPAGILKLKHLNLSGNALRSLRYDCENCSVITSCLETLDLSGNQLEHLNKTWFNNMIGLRNVYLQKNRFRSLSLFDLLLICPLGVQHFDLRSNELMILKDVDKANDAYWFPLQLLVDGNPWSCQWLLNFSHTQPVLFRLFQYTKYISHINVNGLSCEPQEPPTEAPPRVGRIMQVRINGSSEKVPMPLHPNANVSSFTVLYGNPVELHRSQRSGALIIVFMLPLGIALLFLLLYLYLHCERLFHLSYYVSGLPCFGEEKASSGPRFVDHVDIVRYPVELQTELPDGYETPVSGAASICNCTGHRESNCSRTHHVTYESLPVELPYQLYAEIKEPAEESGEKDEMLEGTPGATAPIYDHLTFVEASPRAEELKDIS